MINPKHIWDTLACIGPFRSQTQFGTYFLVIAEESSIRIILENRQKTQGTTSRKRFDQWCRKWFNDNDHTLNHYTSDTGSSVATNISYIAHYFRWYNSHIQEPQPTPDMDATLLEDARTTTLRRLKERKGQARFRQELLAAYNFRCAVTGCKVPEVLEAAHIVSYKGHKSNVINNGILLRSDIHMLYDVGHIKITPTYRIEITSMLGDSEYAGLNGRTISVPLEKNKRPHSKYLSIKYDQIC